MIPARLTIAIPTHNNATTIRSTVLSVLRDMPHDSQLLVRNDGSTDSTAQVLATINDKRLTVLADDSHRGIIASRNLMLAEATTPLFGSVDADDISLPGRIGRQIEALKKADLSFAHVARFRSGIPFAKLAVPTSMHSEEANLRLIFGNPFIHATMVGRTSALREAGGYQDPIVEDYEYWMRCAADGLKIHKIRWVGLLYRRHASQISANPAWRDRSREAQGLARTASDRLIARVLGLPAGFYDWKQNSGPAQDPTLIQEVLNRYTDKARTLPTHHQRLALAPAARLQSRLNAELRPPNTA